MICCVGNSDSPVPGSRSPSPSTMLADPRDDLLDLVEEEEDESEYEEESEEEEPSVVAGGTKEGWGTVASAILWRRMLGILGNVNKIKVPSNHAKVFQCLTSIWDMLAKVFIAFFFLLQWYS